MCARARARARQVCACLLARWPVGHPRRMLSLGFSSRSRRPLDLHPSSSSSPCWSAASQKLVLNFLRSTHDKSMRMGAECEARACETSRHACKR